MARCTVERLYRANGWEGARYGRKPRTTIPDAAAARPADRVERDFAPAAPNRLWVADFSYVPTWTGMVYVAFVVDAFARRVIGWRVATCMSTALVLDALEHAIFTRARGCHRPVRAGQPQRRRVAIYVDCLHHQAHRGRDRPVGGVGR